MPPNYDDEDYFLPLEDQRVFGAGISRKRVPFVRSSEPELHTTTAATSCPPTPVPSTGTRIANKYLSIVMQGTQSTTIGHSQDPSGPELEVEIERPCSAPPPSTVEEDTAKARAAKCEICNLALTTTATKTSLAANLQDTSNIAHSNRPHEASLAHQVCLSHSHPPSHLDRTRPGLRYLKSYGWDPDSRLGLGAPGREGIRDPVKGKLKADTVGLGAEVRLSPPPSLSRKDTGKTKKLKVERLNAKQVRKGQTDMKKKGEALREMFYRSEDVLRYLGEA